MKRILYFVILVCVVTACRKANSEGIPEIKFKKITESIITTASVTSPDYVSPILTIQLRDNDGDFGFEDGTDTSYIYIKNISVPPFKSDSFKFPQILKKLPKGTLKNFVDVEIAINQNNTAGGQLAYNSSTAPSSGKRVDTCFYEVFVKDFKKNKSNVIRTDEPLFAIRP
jgi:hypothetical protein